MPMLAITPEGLLYSTAAQIQKAFMTGDMLCGEQILCGTVGDTWTALAAGGILRINPAGRGTESAAGVRIQRAIVEDMADTCQQFLPESRSPSLSARRRKRETNTGGVGARNFGTNVNPTRDAWRFSHSRRRARRWKIPCRAGSSC